MVWAGGLRVGRGVGELVSWVEAKALAIIGQGRVSGLVIGGDGSLSAAVDGETGGYEVIRRASGVWSCTCLAWTYHLECSHQLAVERLAASRE